MEKPVMAKVEKVNKVFHLISPGRCPVINCYFLHLATVTGHLQLLKMETLKKTLQVQRNSFNRIYEQLSTLLKGPTFNEIEIKSLLQLLDQKIEVLTDLDKQMCHFLVSTESISDEILNLEVSVSDEYVMKHFKIKLLAEKCLQKDSLDDENSLNSQHARSVCSHHRNSLRLPKLEFQKFGGEIKDWVSWWSQFKRINDDDSMENEDKYQYLIQATIPKSRARCLIESYPASAENYPKAIESLKRRFGREEFLIEFYIRELLRLVIRNLNNKTKLHFLYDNISCQLRSLESLNISSETYSAMLFPLVESCLPEELIRVWQRSSEYDDDSSLKDRLDMLMKFLEKEVNREEKIALATSGFDTQKSRKTEIASTPNKSVIPTASGLFNKIKKTCNFCNEYHSSEDCEKAKTWSLTQKREKLKNKGCCHLCLRVGHISKKCRFYLTCSHCKGRHFAIMCPKLDIVEDKSKCDHEQSMNVENNLSNTTYSKIFLQTMVVRLYGNHTSRNVRLIIDTGSERSYITKSMAATMQYEPIRNETIIHSLFGGTNTQEVNHFCYRIRVSNLEKTYSCNFEALDQLTICNNVTSVKPGPWMDELHEIGIQITDVCDGPIDILIGADIAGKLYTGQKHELKCGLVALQTLLGWTVLGKTYFPSEESKSPFRIAITSSMFNKDVAISNLWELDVLGITEPSEAKTKKEKEESIINHFLETVHILEDGRYEVSMPWIEGHAPLPSNFDLSLRRLDNLKKKLHKEGYYKRYEEVFNEWLAEDIIEEVPPEDASKESHYLPHRHVVKESSETTKIRPVFDASAKTKGHPSLNQCIEKGINLIELIPSILTKFRLSKIGVVADIRKAFLQISLCHNDRDFLRFLWYDDKANIRIFRHKRVVFGITCSPFLLGAVIQLHLRKALENTNVTSRVSKFTISKLLNNFYVDNCVVSVDNKEELLNFMKESTELFAEAKFDLRCWEHTVIDGFPMATKLTPVLGLYWNRNFDTLELSSDWFQEINVNFVTKREILSSAHRLFDPIGFTSPVSLFPKLLLQKIWQCKMGWDTEVTEEIKSSFVEWANQMPILINLTIPRWILTDYSKNFSLHVFCDACQYAYATVIFLRSESNQEVQVQLVQAKSRVAPLKKLSICRLELLSATIGARLGKTVIEDIGIEDILVYYWSDSTTVLAWIEREDNWKPFVFNRTQEIKCLTKKEAWYHVPGEINPADLPSRGCLPKHLLDSKWWEGPAWLKQPPTDWPDQHFTTEEDMINSEKKKVVISSICTEKDNTWYHYRISSFKKIVKVFAWMLRFLHNIRYSTEIKRGPLTMIEITTAEKRIFRLIQEEFFIDKNHPRLNALCTFIDADGLIRITTKISNRQDEHEFRYPIVLPAGKNSVVIKLVEEEHTNSCHLGVQALLSLLRERFWILQGRKIVKEVIRKCVVCQRFYSKRLEVAPTPLPIDRVRDAYVFEVVGVDLLGPLYARDGPTIGARHIQFLFLALLGFLVYSTRFGFSVSLVAMTENYSPNPDIPYYNWKNKSLILSMFFWGYTLPQIAIGILSTKFGTKPFLLIALFMNSLCMFLIPTIAEHFGSQGVMACRLLQGFAQGLVVPCVHGGIGKWAPPNERSRVYAFLSTGYMLGIAVGTGTTGFICASWAGWPLTFYLLPSLGFLWVIMYYFFGATSPATHKTITEAEQNYLQISLKSQDIYNVSIPYRAMFTSSPFWAQLIMALCSGWGYSIFTTEMPIYMDKVMKFDIKSNGVISALPPIFVLLAINATAIVTDYLIKHDCLTLTNTRKLMSSIGSFGCAALMLIFVYIPNDSKILCVVIMIAANVLRSINAGGFNINHLDYAPNFAAAVMGIINTCAECFSFITPMAIQYIVYDESDISLWRTVFFTAISLYVFSTCFYLVFASGEAQPWNNSPVRPDVENSNTKEKSDAEIKLLS